MVEVASGQTTWMDIGANDDIYIPRMDWTSTSGVLAIQRLSRSQTELELLLADIATGQTRVVLKEGYEKYWVAVTDDFIFYKVPCSFLPPSLIPHRSALASSGPRRRLVSATSLSPTRMARTKCR